MVQERGNSNTTSKTKDSELCRKARERQEEARERFWKVVEEIGERNADKDPDEVMRFVTEVVDEVRQEQYEREQCAARSR
jgi:hypothetical protein